MTAQTLRELEAKATEGRWNYTGQHYGDRGERFHVIEANGIEVTGEFGGPDEDDCKLIAYLRNHCSDFIKLIEAAEAAYETDGDTRLWEALAPFKDKS